MPAAGREISLASLLRVAKKYLWVVAVCTLVGIGIAAYKNARSTPIYRAAAQIQLTQDSANQFRLDQTGGGDSYIDSARLETEIQILRSSTLALETIQSLNLDQNNDFAPHPPGRAWDLSKRLDRHALISTFQAGLTATRSGHTNILEISFLSPNPALAAQICNRLIDNYVEHNFKDNYQATEQVSKWLQAQLGELQRRLQASQEHMLSMQNQIGIVGIDQTQSIALARLEGLNNDLTKVESDRMMQEARLIAMKSSSPAVLDTLSNDQVISQLRARRTQLADEYSAMHAKYGDANPRIVSLRAEMAQVDQAIRDSENTILKHAEKEVEASSRNEANLKAQLDAEKQRAYDTNSKVVEYSLARREYESNRTLYDQLEQRLQEAGIIAGLHSTSIRMIDPADTPDYPSSPRKTFNLGVGFLGGFMVGVLLSLLIYALDTNIKSLSDVEEKLGLPLLGVIPAAEGKDILPDAFTASATSGVESGWSQVAESYRALRTSLLLSRPGSPPKVILVTSSKPAEGKTSVATLSAIILALSGARVLLIDADLRRPSVHTRFKIANRVGLSSILSGKIAPEEALYQYPKIPSLQILPAGPIAPMPAELLGAREMHNLVDSMRSQYDFIVIDTPPILTVADAMILVPLSDGVALVLRYGETTSNVAVRGRDLLLRSGANLLGTVLNAVDYKSPDYAEYYGRSYNDYYTYRGEQNEQ
ncbi:MAG TPA: polysaccharide biosynthesis tyrosine autokinase [Acidisarcina sp.]|nr:polysaccharide biosynthesis tyrosine autokinase [Acidisarcina sp.]